MARISKTQFIALQKKHKMDSLIGRELGISRQAVYQIRRSYGIKSSMPDQTNRNAEMYKMYIDGATGLEIAKKFGVSISQTYRIIRALDEKKGKAAAKSKRKVEKKIAKKAAAKKVDKKIAKKVVAKKTVKKSSAKKKTR